MKTYDVIITLGNGLTQDWKLPDIVSSRLKKISELYFQKVSNKIIVCGRWSINWDIKGIKPPTTEAEDMRKVLLGLGISDKDILKEEWSRDTIGNAYFSKVKLIKPYQLKTILIVCSDFHLKRVQFLFKKIFNNEYQMDFLTTPTESSKNSEFMQMEDNILNRQKRFLETMRDGDDSFLQTRLYDDPYYKEKRPEKVAKVAMGEIK
jgi:uncharacterized SAM-binding protein YcdF (DUF218 family)